MSLHGQAAARLYDVHVDAIYAYAARRVGPDAAVDVVENVFEQALRRQATRPDGTNSDLAWLLAMASAFLRRHSELERARLLEWQPPVRAESGSIPRVTDPLLVTDGQDASTVTTGRVLAAVAELDPADRDLLFLVAWEGCSSGLAGAATGIAPGAVRGRLGSIRKEIRQHLARIDGGGPDQDTTTNSDRGDERA